MKWQEIKNWIIVTSIILIVIGGITLVLNPDEFTITLNDGTIKAKYSEGNLKVYSGRYVAFEDYLNIYYWNGKGYIAMYKARGTKYSDLSYYQEGETSFVKQTIYYSKGNLTRYFEITEYKIKESFEWNPDDESLRVYFLWNYDKLDELTEKIVYLDKNIKRTKTVMDFGIINNWEQEKDNIIRVERFQNGKLKIRTKIFEGKAEFDPEIILKEEPKKSNGLIAEIGISWIVNKTGAEKDLDVSWSIVNDTATEFCVGYIDKVAYINNLSTELKDASNVPITKTSLSASFVIKKNSLDLEKISDKEKACFVVDYARFEKDMSLKIGWDTVLIDTTDHDDATRWQYGDSLTFTQDGTFHVAFEGSGSDLWYGNNSGGSWSTKEISPSLLFTDPVILIDSDGNLSIIAAGGDDLNLYTSPDNGTTWALTANWCDAVEDIDGKVSCKMGPGDVRHCVAQANNAILTYCNDTDIVEDLSTAADDVDGADITICDDGTIFITGVGSDQDDLDIWSSLNGFTQRYQIDGLLGSAGVAYAPSIRCTNDSQLIIAGIESSDLQIYNSTVSLWNVSWTQREIDGSASYSPRLFIGQGGILGIQLGVLYSGNTGPASTSDIYLANGTLADLDTWTIRQLLQLDDSYWHSVAQANHPSWLNITDTVYYVYTNDSNFGVYFVNISMPYTAVPGEDTCTCPSSANWRVHMPDHCNITSPCDINGYNISFENGTSTDMFNCSTTIIIDNIDINTTGIIHTDNDCYLNTS